MSDEREHHDHFYAEDAALVFGNPLRRWLDRREVALLTSAVPDARACRVLSLGSGDGRIERLAATQVREILGIDISPRGVAGAIEEAGRAGIQNVRFRVGDVTSSFADEAPFDMVWANGLLHHLSDAEIRAVLRTALDRLRPGGLFVSLDPNRARLVRLFKGLVREVYARYHTSGERELDPQSMCRLAREVGFVPVSLRFVDFFLSPLGWLAPGIPRGLVSVLAVLDTLLLATPGLKRLATTFAIIARRPAS